MEWIFYFLASVSVLVSAIIGGILDLELKEKYSYKTKKVFLVWLTMVFACGCFVLFVSMKSSKDAYINSLKGKNKYRIEVRDEYRDGKFYDSDTVYVKIKNK